MGEGTHRTETRRRWAGSKQKLVLILAGTAVAVVAAGILIQIFRAEPSQAAVEESGTARVASRRPLEVMARVNDEQISYDMVADECVARHGREVLEELINRMIIQQACERANVVVTQEEVSQEIVRIAKRFNLAVDQWYQMLQAERNITPQQYRQNVIWPMLALKKLAGTQVEITEEQLNQAFVRNYGPRVKCRMIMFGKQLHAQEVWEKLRQNPDDFEKLAQQHSIDPNSRALGGQIPPIPRYSGNDTLEQAAFRLKQGETSGIIQVGNRYVILRCEGRTEPLVTDISEVQESLYEDLVEEKTQTAVAQVFERLKEHARVDNYLTSTTTGGRRGAGAIRQTSSQQPAGAVSPIRPAGGTTVPPRR